MWAQAVQDVFDHTMESFVCPSATSVGAYAMIISNLPSLCLKLATKKWSFISYQLRRTCQKHVGIARATPHYPEL